MLLSELLRYQLYDCSKDSVQLRSELTYIENYLALERMRRVGVDIRLKVKGDANGKIIAPFLFIPFIENAVKHGLETQKDGFIHISFDLSETQLSFVVSNSKPKEQQSRKDGGIGLVNVKRRLELLYPENHQLTITESSNLYKVVLILELIKSV